MTRFIAFRLGQVIIVLALMSFVIYALIGLMPGDPIDLMVAGDPHLTAADAARLKAAYGLDRPLSERYANWARHALSGDLGYSRLYGQPVLSVLVPRLGNTALRIIPDLAPRALLTNVATPVAIGGALLGFLAFATALQRGETNVVNAVSIVSFCVGFTR
mgnify:CR=1 FL=1